MRRSGIVLLAVGIMVTVFGVVWMAAIFPNFKKIPSDYSSVDVYEGFYTTVDPVVEQIQGNAAIQQLRNSPEVLGMLADSGVQQFLANPVYLALLANLPALQGSGIDPGALQGMVPPGVLALLSHPSIQGLLSDPLALQLVTDPRTIPLLADPTALPVVSVPVQIREELEAIEIDGDRVLMRQRVITTRIDMGEELQGFPVTDRILVVDRSSMEFLEGTEGGRTGGFSFPFDVEKEQSYQLWVSAAKQPLEARYVRSDKLNGIEVLIYRIEETNNRSLAARPRII